MSESKADASTQKLPRSWHPELPIDYVPIFVWPPRPLAVLKYHLGPGFVMSVNLIFVGLAIVAWFLLGASVEPWVEFRGDWIAQVYAINLGLVVLLTGGSHWYFYTLKGQGETRKIDPTALSEDNPRFFTGNQVWDNIFWTCVSGVTIWTVWQVAFMWGYANNLLPWATWGDHPIWFVLQFPLIIIWFAFHFYVVHRLLHRQPLYDIAHSLHHRNVNISPWSGLSMHPLEHVLYFSTIVIHLVVPSHPIHVIFHIYFAALAAGTTHTGYAYLRINGKDALGLGDFYHQLHHRYFECNYGTPTMPWDKWFGTFHDGTPEATVRMRQRRAKLRNQLPE